MLTQLTAKCWTRGVLSACHVPKFGTGIRDVIATKFDRRARNSNLKLLTIFWFLWYFRGSPMTRGWSRGPSISRCLAWLHETQIHWTVHRVELGSSSLKDGFILTYLQIFLEVWAKSSWSSNVLVGKNPHDSVISCIVQPPFPWCPCSSIFPSQFIQGSKVCWKVRNLFLGGFVLQWWLLNSWFQALSNGFVGGLDQEITRPISLVGPTGWTFCWELR